jgi:hypothetical protein
VKPRHGRELWRWTQAAFAVSERRVARLLTSAKDEAQVVQAPRARGYLRRGAALIRSLSHACAFCLFAALSLALIKP